MFYVMLNFILLLIMGGFTSYFAQKRGRDPVIWFLIGAFFGLLGLIALFLFPNLTVKSEADSEIPQEREEDIIEEKQPLANEWFYLNQNHEQVGPVAIEQLKNVFIANEISEDSFVWSDGMENWKKIKEIEPLEQKLQEEPECM